MFGLGKALPKKATTFGQGTFYEGWSMGLPAKARLKMATFPRLARRGELSLLIHRKRKLMDLRTICCQLGKNQFPGKTFG